MAIPRRTGTALAAVALTLILASYSGANPANGPSPDNADNNDRRAEGSEGVETPSGTAGQDGEQDPPPPPSPEDIDGSAGTAAPTDIHAETTVQIQSAELRVFVYELLRSETTVELTLLVHNSSPVSSAQLRHLLGPWEDEYADLSSVDLVDTVNGRVHRVARGRDGRCVCSLIDAHLELWAGDTVRLSATFGAPPEEVGEMDVRVPVAGTFSGVPVV